MELELKHIIPYLEHNLKIIRKGSESEVLSLVGVQSDNDIVHQGGKTPLKHIKPILLPLIDAEDFLSDRFDDDIDVRTFCNEDFLNDYGFYHFDEVLSKKVEWIPLGLFNLLVKHHFDVFDLIPKGLAVDRTTFLQAKLF